MQLKQHGGGAGNYAGESEGPISRGWGALDDEQGCVTDDNLGDHVHKSLSPNLLFAPTSLMRSGSTRIYVTFFVLSPF